MDGRISTIQLTGLGLSTVPAPWRMSGENTDMGALQKITSGVVCVGPGFVWVGVRGNGWWLRSAEAKAELCPICKWDFVNRCNHQSKLFILTGLFPWPLLMEKGSLSPWSEEKQSVCFHMVVAVTPAHWFTLCIGESGLLVTNLKCIN